MLQRTTGAAESLVRAGLVDVYEESLGGGSVLLMGDEALAVVGARDNWWREDGGQKVAPGEDDTWDVTFYSLAITDAGREMLRFQPPGPSEMPRILDHFCRPVERSPRPIRPFVGSY